MTEREVAHDYDRWLKGGSLSSRVFSFYGSLAGMVLVNTPAFRLHQELQLRPPHRVLDIGCGRGSLLQVIASHVPFETPPTGIDLSGEMLRRARRDLRRPSHPVSLLQGTATALPLANESIDIAVCGYVIKHLIDRDLLSFFTELKRVLSPGGIGVIWDFAPARSRRLNALNEWQLRRGVRECHLRDYTQASAFALGAGFEWVGNANLRPFLWPLISRVSLIVGKAPPEWLNP